MGISFDQSLGIAGYRPATFKNVLSALMRSRDVGALIDRKSLFPLRRDGAIVLEECIDRGLVDPETYRPTAEGEALARAKARKRATLADADRVLDLFLENVERLNRDNESLSRVDEVWLFGSLMRRQPDVGDIDLAVSKSWNTRFGNTFDDREPQADRLLMRHPDAPAYWPERWSKEDWLTDRALFGKRRHPLLASQSGTSDLEALHVPCRLVYDRKRGGRVDDPILRNHPASLGRADTVPPPAQMPDLEPAVLRPMDGRWVAAFDPRGKVSPYGIFGGWTDDAHRLFPDFSRELHILADGHGVDGTTWSPKLEKATGFDGRESLIIMDSHLGRGVAVTLKRDMELTSEAWTLHWTFAQVEMERKRRSIHVRAAENVAAVATLILAVDAERMLRRAADLGLSIPVLISPDAADGTDRTKSLLVDLVVANLAERTTYIEPSGWPGAPVLPGRGFDREREGSR